MKRYGYLFEQIVDPDNLRLAFYKAQLHKSSKCDVQVFRKELDKNLLHIRTHLLEGNYPFGNYHYFTIFDPKQRLICAASFEERVIHHAVMNICNPYFENHQISGSYACRKEKGVFKAVEKASEYQKKYQWYLKLDIRKYFDSIDHNVLFEQLERLYKDERLLLLFREIINSYQISEGKGIPIGNLTSQYFANHYLSIADKYAVHILKIAAYVRYMDNIIMWSNDKEELIQKGLLFDSFVKESLKLTLKPFILNRSSHGLPALGFLIYPTGQIRLNSRSKKRFITKLTQYTNLLNTEKISEKEFSQKILALYAFINHANSKGFCIKLLQKQGLNTEGSNRVIRGGSWNNDARNARVSNRNNNNPENRNNNIGFRLAFSTKHLILNKCLHPSLEQG